MINVVNIADLDKIVASTIQKVYDGVDAARKAGNFQVELPASIDFKMIVVAENGWQALESKTDESGKSTGDGSTISTEKGTEKGTVTDHQDSTETQGGYTIDERTGSGTDVSKVESSKTDQGTNKHVENSTANQTNRTA